MTSLLIQGPSIYLENEIIENGLLRIENQKIASISSADSSFMPSDHALLTFPKSFSLIPGRIDLHVHGVAGVDVMDASPEALMTMSRMLAQEGTTSFLATTLSMPIENIEAAIKNVLSFMENDQNEGATILGLHLEGPFLAPSKMGAHQNEYLLLPDCDLMGRWQHLAKGMIKLVTLAPELPGAKALIRYLLDLNIIASIGHSDASYEQAKEAMDWGCRHVTHLFNAMSGLNHRKPGVALAALQSSILCELIADGHHLAWEILRLAFDCKGHKQLCLVTDSMRAKCMPEGCYHLGDQPVFLKNGAARLEDGTLAGSILTMDQAVKNLLDQGICHLLETIYLCSINPAKQLGLFHELGSIALNKYADLVVLDENHKVVLTLCKGKIVYNPFNSFINFSQYGTSNKV